MKLILLLQSSPQQLTTLRSCYHLALGGLDRGDEVWLACRGEGVYAALASQHRSPLESPWGNPSGWWAALRIRGLKLVVHEACAEVRGLKETEFFEPGTRLVSLEDWSHCLQNCDKLVSL